MTAEQLRSFREVVRTWRDVNAYGTGGAVMAWNAARLEFERTLGFPGSSVECWLQINARINAATHRLIAPKGQTA